MKRFFLIISLIFIATITAGCEDIFRNEIYNKAYDVTIDIGSFEEILPAVIQKASPAVIGVTNYRYAKDDVKRKHLLPLSIGSGVIYKGQAFMKDGTIVEDYSSTKNSSQVDKYRYYLITNKHVIDEHVKTKVYLGDDTDELDAVVLGADEKVDLAIMRFDTRHYIQALDFGNSDDLVSGNIVVALGHPGYDYYDSATMGIVSHPLRYISQATEKTPGAGDTIVYDWESEYIQHDAAINPGNSGGALVNIRGELVGINTFKLVERLGGTKIDNMGFAIPIEVVKRLIPSLEAGKPIQRPTLGIQGIEVKQILRNPIPNDDYIIPAGIDYGIYITEVNKGIAKKAGIRVDDIILKFNDVLVTRTHIIRMELEKFIDKKGAQVPVHVYRDGDEIIIPVTIK